MSTSDSRTTTSSRLSQFGLYRSIDARTEEFLRLSRKRQIRQGCACAAVSTAITVTVVVTVLLVYEYNISPNTNSTRKYAKKPNWLGLLNDSTIEGNFNKANVNIDTNTIKLLPLLIKALNHNSYLTNELEVPTLNNMGKDGKETTEFPYERNVFSDPKKRIKNSKIFNTEYKPPTMVQIPSRIYPTTDEYAKAKKLREYQIMLTHFDKLLNAGTVSPNDEVNKDKLNIKEKQIATTVSSNLELPLKINLNLQDTEASTLSTVPQSESTKKHCKCKDEIKLLLKNFLKDLQEIMPEIFAEPEDMTNNNDNFNTTPLTILNYDKISETTAKITTSSTQSITSTLQTSSSTIPKNNLADIKPVTFRPVNVKTYLQDYHATRQPDTKNKESVEVDLNDFISKNIFIPRQHNIEILDSPNIDKYTRLYFHRQASTTMRSSAIPTTSSSPKTSTEPMQVYTPRISDVLPTKMSTEKEITNTERNKNIVIVTKSSIDKTTLPLFEFYDENDYEPIKNLNDTTVKPRTILDDLGKLDVHANELLKGTLVPKNSTTSDTAITNNIKSETKKVKKKPHKERVHQGTLKEVTNDSLTQNDLNSNNTMLTYLKLGNFLQEAEPPASSETMVDSNVKRLEENNDTKTQEKRQNDHVGTNITEPGETFRDLLNHSDSDEDNIRITDDIQDEEVLNEAVDIITKPMKRYNKNKNNKDKSVLANYQFAAGTGLDIDSNNLNYQPRSMIPEHRPTYLEIDRNGWQDNNDYGTGDNIPYELN